MRRNPKIRRLAIKQARGTTRKAAATTRPGTKATAQAKKRRPQQKIKLRVGHGLPFDPEDIKTRERQFLRQQRENKVKVRSLVRRDAATGRQATSRVNFQRGQRVAATRLKQFAEFGEMEVIREVNVTSSWVSQVHLVKFRNQPALAVTFRSGFVALYPTTNIRDYEAMSGSASKGKYIWAALYHGVPGAGAPYISIGF